MIVGMMRVKNEGRWIERSIQSIRPVCNMVLVMDDSSEDDTCYRAAAAGAAVFNSPFRGLDETRDKNWLLDRACAAGAKWILCIDGDEMLAPASVPILKALIASGQTHCISMRIPYLWDSEEQIRVDGVYGEFRRHSAFRPGRFHYHSTTANGFHCGNVPRGEFAGAHSRDDIQLLHFGYMLNEDRARKYAWYNAMDPANEREDRYRHIAAGLTETAGWERQDLVRKQVEFRREAGLPTLTPEQLLPAPPAAADRTLHAGPLELRRL